MNSTSDDPSLDEAPILHVDLDAFFASVEMLDDPRLRARPLAVGGAGERGVVASVNYEARCYGVHSGMSSVVARRRCPDLVIVAGHFERYEAYSRDFHAVVNDLTPTFEPLGLDEVFADLRGLARLQVRPLAAARSLRERVRDELHLECGVGLARNKLFAKLASRRAKPFIENGEVREGPGVVWVSPAREAAWLEELPVRALWGVGPATESKLAQLGVRAVRDLRRIDEAALARYVGPSMAATLVGFSRGEDPRGVVVERGAKSLGHDQTFARSLTGVDLARAVGHHAGVVSRALRERRLVARTLSLLVRYDDLSSVTRSQTLSFGVDDPAAIAVLGEALLESIPARGAVRLLGLYASSFVAREANEVQLRFAWPDGDSSLGEEGRRRQVGHEALRDAVDEVRAKFGVRAVARASDLGPGGVRVDRQRGDEPFGPRPDDDRGGASGP
ncbi:MAG: DNA polymerase IV [Acidimicrobiales bacterium]